MVAPWSGFWDRNLFLDVAPSFEQIFASPFTRGAVSGVGAITVIAGLVELSGVLAMRQRARTEPPPQDGLGG